MRSEDSDDRPVFKPAHVPYGSVPLRPYGLVKTTKAKDRDYAWYALASVVVALLVSAVLVVGICTPRMGDRKDRLELKQLGDVAQQLHAKKSVPPELGEARGREFYEGAFNHGLLPPEILSKLVSLNGPDSPASKPEPGELVKLLPENCSYTGPQGNAITQLLRQRGPYRRVLMTFNAENWHNFPDHGVAVMWSDGEAQWLTQEEAEDEWGITEEEWADPAGKLFGKKAPFEFTHE